MVGRRWAGQPEEQSRPVNKYILLYIWGFNLLQLPQFCYFLVPLCMIMSTTVLSLLQPHSSMRSTALPHINGIGDDGS